MGEGFESHRNSTHSEKSTFIAAGMEISMATLIPEVNRTAQAFVLKSHSKAPLYIRLCQNQPWETKADPSGIHNELGNKFKAHEIQLDRNLFFSKLIGAVFNICSEASPSVLVHSIKMCNRRALV